MTDLIKQDQHDGVLTLTIDRPDKLNALTNGMYTRLADLLFAADENDEIRVVIVTGGPNCFTSGNDLVDFLQDPPTHLDSPAFRLMRAVTHLQKPLIAAVCGAAIGIGTTLLLHCDQVLVTRNAKLRTPFVNLGLCPEFGASLLLPRRLGHARAARLLLLGDSLDGNEAVAWGLANEAFDDGEQCLAAASQDRPALPGDAPASLASVPATDDTGRHGRTASHPARRKPAVHPAPEHRRGENGLERPAQSQYR